MVEFVLGSLLITFLLMVMGIVAIKVTKQFSGLVNFGEVINVTDNVGVQASPSVLKAQPGVLTVRTNNTSGSLTMNNSNHGIVTGQRVDLYWVGGQCYGAIVGTVSGSVVPIASVSGGTNLPISTTAITVGIATSSPFNCVGNNIQCLAMGTAQNGYFVFNNGSTDVYAAFVTGGYTHSWKVSDVSVNPLAGATPTLVYMSHTNTSNAITTMQAAAVTH